MKEVSAVAKPKPMNLNLSSMRKIPSQEVRDPNSPGIKVWTRVVSQRGPLTDDGRTMYSQERQNDAQTSNIGKQERRDESSTQPAGGNSLRKEEVHPFGRRNLEFQSMLISDSGYLEKVFKNIKKKVNLSGDAPPLGIQAQKTKVCDSYGTRLH